MYHLLLDEPQKPEGLKHDPHASPSSFGGGGGGGLAVGVGGGGGGGGQASAEL